MCRNIWKNAEKKGAMCNGRLHIMAQVVSVFSLNSWNQSEGRKMGKIKMRSRKKKAVENSRTEVLPFLFSVLRLKI